MDILHVKMTFYSYVGILYKLVIFPVKSGGKGCFVLFVGMYLKMHLLFSLEKEFRLKEENILFDVFDIFAHVQISEKIAVTGGIITHASRTDHIQGRSRRKWVAMTTTVASTTQGTRPSFSTVPHSLLRAGGSRSRPARVKITTNAIFL